MLETRAINERYSINELGEVFKGEEECPLTIQGKSLVVRIDGVRKVLSIIILEAFQGSKPEGHQPHAIDGNTRNTRADNWEWKPTESHTIATERAFNSNEFWELNDVQKKHYSTFLSLIRIPKTKAKGRKCVGCKYSLEKQNKGENNYLCKECKKKVNRYGALAVV